MLAGAERHSTPGHAIAVIAVSSVAVFLGSSLLYAVMRRGGHPLLVRYGKYLHVTEQRIATMKTWLEHRGRLAIIAGRLIPGLRIPTTMLAGSSGVSYREYAGTAAIAAVVWSCFYYAVGGILGHTAPVAWAVVADALDDLPRWLVVASLVLLATGAIGGWHVRRRLSRFLPANAATRGLEGLELDLVTQETNPDQGNAETAHQAEKGNGSTLSFVEVEVSECIE
jgi:membrane protein DedA with SNARE-associated domain